MAVAYTYKKYKDVYTLQNINSNNISYIFEKVDCDNVENIESGVLVANAIYTLPLNRIDGTYQLRLSDGNLNTALIIKYYNNLLISVINSVEVTICKCCQDCDECDETDYCDVQLSAILSTLSYSILMNPEYARYINIIAESIKCKIDDVLLFSLTNKLINGEEDQKDLVLKLIGMYYLAYYVKDVLAAEDEEEAEYIKQKYNYSKIVKCLRKLSIDIDETNDGFLDTPSIRVHYWQGTLGQTFAQIQALFSSAFVASKPYQLFDTFEQGYTVPYTVAGGRPCFAIVNTDDINFQLKDQFNGDVTDEFDSIYSTMLRTTLFVAKEPKGISEVYFKFKKITYGI